MHIGNYSGMGKDQPNKFRGNMPDAQQRWREVVSTDRLETGHCIEYTEVFCLSLGEKWALDYAPVLSN